MDFYAVARFMSSVRPDLWADSAHAHNSINEWVDRLNGDGDFFSTGGFTVRKQGDEVIVSLDLMHVYDDDSTFSWLTADYRDKFKI